jgi:hypothetical protein
MELVECIEQATRLCVVVGTCPANRDFFVSGGHVRSRLSI